MTEHQHSDVDESFPEQAADSRASGRVASARAGLPFRVLVVDDETSIREATSAMLAEQGYEVLTAGDGQQALELLTEFRPDLVITDLRMPRLSGYELLEIMRERFPGLPVIVISGEFSGDEQPPNVAADAFLQKGSCYFTALCARIKQLLSSSTISKYPESDGEANLSHTD